MIVILTNKEINIYIMIFENIDIKFIKLKRKC